MARFGLFLFLVVLVPLGVYWAGNGPGGLDRLPRELRELRGRRPAPARPDAPEPGTDEAEPAPAPEPPAEPAPKPADEPGPKPEPSPAPEARVSPAERARKLYDAGRFEEAVAAYAGLDAKRRALALLGAAFVKAFPEGLPPERYVVVKTRTGDTFEGFLKERDGRVTLTTASGKSFGFPTSAIATRNPLTREDAKERIAKQTITQGLDARTRGMRLFALIEGACAAGRPDAIAPLLARTLQLDEQEPYVLSAVRHRVRPEFQKDLYLAFATCQSPLVMGGQSVLVRTPTRLGGRSNGPTRGRSTGNGRGDPYAPRISNAKVRDLLRKASPLRKKGEKLYRRIVLEGIDKARLEDVETAIRSLEDAIEYYEKAAMLEDSGAIYALLRQCSKLNFNLRFWKQQIEAR